MAYAFTGGGAMGELMSALPASCFRPGIFLTDGSSAYVQSILFYLFIIFLGGQRPLRRVFKSEVGAYSKVGA
jgi:hypothetical protein